ncbi:unnamed protein product [Dimorphilus gyrociliatus]|uniref:Uncharacterized protein n=1 Tax=Dimorphilus gyrociliatus TaxID=2664684 RepID=A0A7I8VGL7_9ANNE|nr:unnamed protein product [Dimorphilus gyrociliatus]
MAIVPKNCILYVGKNSEKLPSKYLQKSLNIVKLDISNNAFKDLSFLFAFTNLQELVADNNRLRIPLKIPRLDSLRTICLNKNNLDDLNAFLDEIADKLSGLTYLSLLGNPICPTLQRESEDDDILRYRCYVLYKLPSLKFLDSSPVKITELQRSHTHGEFYRIARPVIVQVKDSEEELLKSKLTPLPMLKTSEKKTSFGKCKYMYKGKHSEGNRFIRNADL